MAKVLRPRLAVTMGDPAGVGPELCAWLLAQSTVTENCDLLVFGDAETLRRAAATRDVDLAVPVFSAGDRPKSFPAGSGILDFQDVDWDSFETGVVSSAGGASSFLYLEAAIQACLDDVVDGLVTAPINKASLHAAGINHPGHTEILADHTDTPSVGMMLSSTSISCGLVTTHIPLSEVSSALTIESIQRIIELSAETLHAMYGKDRLCLTVCGLNPHAGEQGLFGDEERTVIEPAIEAARSKLPNIEIIGPLPPDTAFLPRQRERTDGYVCMYHDQGLIPLKALSFDDAINVTMGLPIVRTSVDHGTAFDIAWKNIASPSSMLVAVEMGARLANARLSNQ